MALCVASLNSGSNGNCFYIGNDKEAILVDAGISCREIEIRMKRLGLDIKKVKAVFISHEHGDHIRGVSVLSKKYQVPVYITPLTHQFSGLRLDRHLCQSFKGAETSIIGGITVMPFPKFHDAADPYSFLISHREIRVGVFTDIGVPCEQLISHFTQCNAAFLEANYDEDMLEKGNYPYHLKKRIRGGKGHLSNSQALHIFKTHRPSFMTHLFLSHLSRNNNCQQLVADLFNRHADKTQIVIASRYQETAVYQISNVQAPEVLPHSIQRSQLEFAFD